MINEKGLSLLLFKDARVDQKILDETFTPFGWRGTHQSIGGNLYCTVEVWDKEKQQWIAKRDVGTVSYSEKGQASDYFKRACFNWGVGREFYTAPFIWIFSYNEQREISTLVIVNSRGAKVFEMKPKSEPKQGKQEKKTKNSSITDVQRIALEKELQRTGVLMEAVLGRYNIRSLDEMTKDVYIKALNGLKKMLTDAVRNIQILWFRRI